MMHARSHLRSRLHAVVCCSLGLALPGCAGRIEAPTRPAVQQDAAAEDAGVTQTGAFRTAAQPGFYPLHTGDRWVHRLVSTLTMIPDAGDGPPSETWEYTVHRRIFDPIVVDGRTYLPEEVTTVGPSGSWSYAIVYRQDASGLYEYAAIRGAGAAATGRAGPQAPALERMIASRPAHERAAFAAAADELTARIAALGGPGRVVAAPAALRRWPSTAGPFEQTRLRYPLEPKAEWVIGAGFFPAPLIAEVVDVEALELPPGTFSGHRIRLRGGYIGPRDSAEMWFGRSGFLQSVVHLEATATDESGNLGTWSYDARETLLEVRLVGGPLSDERPDDALLSK